MRGRGSEYIALGTEQFWCSHVKSIDISMRRVVRFVDDALDPANVVVPAVARRFSQ